MTQLFNISHKHIPKVLAGLVIQSLCLKFAVISHLNAAYESSIQTFTARGRTFINNALINNNTGGFAIITI